MSIHFKVTTDNSVTRWVEHLPTFYVWACDGNHAQDMALRVTLHGRSVRDIKGTSGSAIVEEHGDAVVETYHSWCDDVD